MKTTKYTATHPETGEIFTRSTERATGYAFAVIIQCLRPGEENRCWAEWAATKPLAEKNAASWNAKRGKRDARSTRRFYTPSIDYGLGYTAIVVPAVPA